MVIIVKGEEFPFLLLPITTASKIIIIIIATIIHYELSTEERKRGIVCASAGNHAQGVALACNKLGIKGTIFMPVPTPKQKLGQVRMFGGSNVYLM